jgi:hypothetical protein
VEHYEGDAGRGACVHVRGANERHEQVRCHRGPGSAPARAEDVVGFLMGERT